LLTRGFLNASSVAKRPPADGGFVPRFVFSEAEEITPLPRAALEWQAELRPRPV